MQEMEGSEGERLWERLREAPRWGWSDISRFILCPHITMPHTNTFMSAHNKIFAQRKASFLKHPAFSILLLSVYAFLNESPNIVTYSVLLNIFSERNLFIQWRGEKNLHTPVPRPGFCDITKETLMNHFKTFSSINVALQPIKKYHLRGEVKMNDWNNAVAQVCTTSLSRDVVFGFNQSHSNQS